MTAVASWPAGPSAGTALPRGSRPRWAAKDLSMPATRPPHSLESLRIQGHKPRRLPLLDQLVVRSWHEASPRRNETRPRVADTYGRARPLPCSCQQKSAPQCEALSGVASCYAEACWRLRLEMRGDRLCEPISSVPEHRATGDPANRANCETSHNGMLSQASLNPIEPRQAAPARFSSRQTRGLGE